MLLAEKFGALITATICDGTIITCVTRSRSTVSMNARRVELLLQHERAAEEPRRHQRDERAVEHERAGVHHDALRREPELAREHRAVQRAHVVRVHDALRLAGRAARVDDVVDVVVADVDRAAAASARCAARQRGVVAIAVRCRARRSRM